MDFGADILSESPTGTGGSPVPPILKQVLLMIADNVLNAHYLVASLIWGSVGLGFFIYGKKQQSMVPLFGGLLIIGISYFIDSALYMSLAAIALLSAVYWLKRQGH